MQGIVLVPELNNAIQKRLQKIRDFEPEDTEGRLEVLNHQLQNSIRTLGCTHVILNEEELKLLTNY